MRLVTSICCYAVAHRILLMPLMIAVYASAWVERFQAPLAGSMTVSNKSLATIKSRRKIRNVAWEIYCA
jgi:hypothetical protein